MTKMILGTSNLFLSKLSEDNTDTTHIEVLMSVNEMHMNNLNSAFFKF